MKCKRRYYIYLGIMAALVFSSFFWGSPGQWWNMRQARREVAKVKAKLKDDARFSGIKFLYSSANMGKNIYVDGVVADQDSLDYLKTLMDQVVSPRFNTIYMVQVKTDTDVPIKDVNDIRNPSHNKFE